MSSQPYYCAPVRITSSGVVGDSAAPVIVYGYCVESGAAISSPYFISGIDTNGTLVMRGDNSQGGANANRLNGLPAPTMFTGGCYVSFDANTNAVTVFYSQHALR